MNPEEFDSCVCLESNNYHDFLCIGRTCVVLVGMAIGYQIGNHMLFILLC